jgi:tritrans,polycis-undecaprenyl-diphosphate synthase [geranylgeranyl-diphosphate specific]
MNEQNKALRVPVHLGIIPDGNRRWAKKHNLPAFKGHEAGLEKFKDILKWCKELGIKTVTLYTFSLENFSRSPEEVKFLMDIIKKQLKKFAKDKEVHDSKVRLSVIGNLELLPGDVVEAAKTAMEATKDYSNYFLNLAVAYGGRAEILNAAKRIALDVKNGKMPVEEINEEIFTRNLSQVPDMDLVIRTSEQRLSGFFPWHSTYAEFIFMPDKLFPELTKEDFIRVIEEFNNRERRFGK